MKKQSDNLLTDTIAVDVEIATKCFNDIRRTIIELGKTHRDKYKDEIPFLAWLSVQTIAALTAVYEFAPSDEHARQFILDSASKAKVLAEHLKEKENEKNRG
jgi:hypothetical protein